MAIKAGRVGVNPLDVDPISGRINSSSTEGYTKAEADDKFLAKSDASSTYETKSEASTAHNALQPKTLAVPISMLVGSQLVTKTTVEDVLATMDGAMTSEELTEMVLPVDGSANIISEYTINSAKTKLIKIGKMVFMDLRIEEITANSWVILATIPAGYRPILDVNDLNLHGRHTTISVTGDVSCIDDFTNGTLIIHTSWITE